MNDETPESSNSSTATINDVRGLRDIASLERALNGESVLLRVAALQALAGMSDPSALPLVTAATKDSWRAVRIVASESAVRLSGGGMAIAEIGDIYHDDLTSRRRASSELNSELFAHYVGGIRDHDAAIRLAAAEVLGETGSADAASPLIDALSDSDMAVVSQATESLIQLGDVAVPALREASKNSNKMVRDSATWCLQQIA